MLKIGYIKYSLTTNFGYKVYRGFLNLVFLHEFQCNFWYIERFISGISVFRYIYKKWCTEAMLILSYFQLILMTGLTTITHNGQTWKNYSRQHATNCTKSESLLHECSEMTLLLSFQLGSSLFYCLFSTPALIFFFSSSFYSICCPFKELSHCTLDALLEFVSSSSLVFHTLLLSSMCGESFLTDIFTRKRLVFLSNSMRTLSLVFVKRYSG